MLFDFHAFFQNRAINFLIDGTEIIVLAGVVVSSILAHFARDLGNFFGVMDDSEKPAPGGGVSHKRHIGAIPAVGGIIFALSGSLMVLLDLAIFPKPSPTGFKGDIAITLAVGSVMLMGLVDDRRHIAAKYRLLISLIVFSILIAVLPNIVLRTLHFGFLNADLQLGAWAVPFTLTCLIGFQNAVNMVDGRNGLLLGLSILWMLHFLAHAPFYLMPLMLGLLATGIVVFVANIRGRLFMGDCGAYGLATYFGVAALNLLDKAVPGAEPLRASGVVIMFMIPSLDLIRLVFARIRAGHSPFRADNNHLHHLLDDSIGWRRGWFVYMALAGAPIAAWHATHRYAPLIVCLTLVAYVALVIWAKSRIRAKASAGDVIMRSHAA